MNRLAHVGTCGQVRFFDRVDTFGKSDYLSLFEILPPDSFTNIFSSMVSIS